MSISLPLGLAFKNSLFSHVLFNRILKESVEVLKAIDGLDSLKFNPELILLTCNLIEQKMKDNRYSIDKKELALLILDTVFSYADDEKEAIKKQIQFLYDNKKIKKVSWWKFIVAFMLSLLPKV